jgi:hypothetical protein
MIYDVQHVFNGGGGQVECVKGKMEWDKEDKNSKPYLIMADGARVEMKLWCLEEKNDGGRVFYIYKDPGFRVPRRDMSTPESKEQDYEEIELPDYRELTEDGRRMVLEVTVRHNGIWRVHKKDPDTVFPSEFHADRVDAAEKLDLYTGEVYSAVNRNRVRAEPKKAMRFIYRELQKSKEERIQSCLQKKAKFTYLN